MLCHVQEHAGQILYISFVLKWTQLSQYSEWKRKEKRIWWGRKLYREERAERNVRRKEEKGKVYKEKAEKGWGMKRLRSRWYSHFHSCMFFFRFTIHVYRVLEDRVCDHAVMNPMCSYRFNNTVLFSWVSNAFIYFNTNNISNCVV